MKHLISSITYILIIFVCINATLTPKSQKIVKNEEKIAKQIIGPRNSSIFDKNLVKETPQSIEIINNYQSYYRYTNERHFDGMVLGYVTPWNNHGYDIAKIFANKFTHISPVWLQIKRVKNMKYELGGTHDIDQNWMNDVRQAGIERQTKIVPRVLFDGWTGQDFVLLLTNEDEIKALIKVLLNANKKWKFDGYVLEVWSQLTGRIKPELLINLIQKIGKSLLKNDLDFILVVPPKRDEEFAFTDRDFHQLYPYVTGFSLMTYDYSSVHRPGPNAPIDWMRECVTELSRNVERRAKLLTGLNFYGFSYSPTGGGPIVNHEYVKLLRKFKGKLEYDTQSAENYFEIRETNGKLLIFYPTLYSIEKRLQFAREKGTGLSIWELGQGLDYFYDLL